MWRKEPKMTLPVGSIIPKLDMDTQISGAINTWESLTSVDASHATLLRSRRCIGSFVINIFW